MGVGLLTNDPLPVHPNLVVLGRLIPQKRINRASDTQDQPSLRQASTYKMAR